MEKIPVVAVVGPTASGKTALAVEIALRWRGEVISADSMQIYRGMEIATAKPTPAERKGIPHHLMDFLDPASPFSVAEYAALARETIRQVWERGSLPILAGGTGLYINAVLDNIQFAEMGSDPALRQELAEYGRIHGAAALWELLRECDPETAASLHENNQGRVIRAIEVCRLTGIPMSEHRRRSRLEPSPYQPLKLGITYRDRQKLYDRINLRVDEMMNRGLLAEAADWLGRPEVPEPLTAVQAIGYKELAGYFQGLLTLEEAVENLKRETRRYAKRQLTWFRKDPEIHWFCPDEGKKWNSGEIPENIGLCIDQFLKMWYDIDSAFEKR